MLVDRDLGICYSVTEGEDGQRKEERVLPETKKGPMGPIGPGEGICPDLRERRKAMGFFAISDLKSRTLAEGVQIKVLSGERMMVVFFDMEPGAVMAEHAHPHEQMGIVLEGEVELVINGEKKTVRKGDAYHVPSGVLHGGTVLTSPVRVLDVFAPPREDYR
jgi:quercetin dioxygenase-like cupin family protein